MSLDQDQVVNTIIDLLKETFEQPSGIYLDKNTSLFQTLEGLSAEQASIPVGGMCASLAAQVTHVMFYFESFERFALQHDTNPVNWDQVWQTVEKVTPEEWARLINNLKNVYQRMNALFHADLIWNEEILTGALSIVVHSAYHLGEIRQALCVLG
jgi:hypothetical protein